MSLSVLSDAQLLHCDITPENILLLAGEDGGEGQVKLIDFGSACFSHQTVYSYIQSRFYRAPEVILGSGYGPPLDLWSFGAVLAELFLGVPLLPGTNNYHMLVLMEDMFGPIPQSLLARGTNTLLYYKRVPLDGGDALAREDSKEDVFALDEEADRRRAPEPFRYVLKSLADVDAKTRRQVEASPSYFRGKKLSDLVLKYPFVKDLSAEKREAETQLRRHFASLLASLLQMDPLARASIDDAATAPFFPPPPAGGFVPRRTAPLSSSPFANEVVFDFHYVDRKKEAFVENYGSSPPPGALPPALLPFPMDSAYHTPELSVGGGNGSLIPSSPLAGTMRSSPLSFLGNSSTAGSNVYPSPTTGALPDDLSAFPVPSLSREGGLYGGDSASAATTSSPEASPQRRRRNQDASARDEPPSILGPGAAAHVAASAASAVRNPTSPNVRRRRRRHSVYELLLANRPAGRGSGDRSPKSSTSGTTHSTGTSSQATSGATQSTNTSQEGADDE